MTDDALVRSLDEGAHRLLQRLVGQYAGSARTWFEPGRLADESPIRGTIRSLLDGRFVVHEYQSSLEGRPLEGLAVLGYYLPFERFIVSWVDSFHMGSGIMLSEGGPGEDRPSGFSVLGHYADPSSDERWGWRTELDLPSESELSIRHHNITPSGEEALAVEIRYRRID